MSLSLIQEVLPRGAVIDVGGGASPLAGRLLNLGYSVAVLDIAPAAMERAQHALRERASLVRWLVADVTAIKSVGRFDLWHDRATFHFLTDPAHRKRYLNLLRRAVPVGGHAIIATFAKTGPTKCSGLDVVRYDAESLARELGRGFTLLKSVPETHLTPWGTQQDFQYAVFRRLVTKRQH